MRRIHAATPPPSHSTHRASNAAFDELSSDPAVRRALWNEQGGRCAYCERTLRDPARHDHQTRIEHFHPQSGRVWTADCSLCSGAVGNHDAPTKWTNLLLCCDGNQVAGSEFTCDKSKAATDICAEFRNPKIWTHEQVVVVDRDGRARPSSGLPAGAEAVVDAVLNLNAKHLVAARRAVIGARLRKLERMRSTHHGLTAQQREKLAAGLRVEASTAEFASALLTVADGLLRRGIG
jgi:uncharacterized protein (TIGR02646 family)